MKTLCTIALAAAMLAGCSKGTTDYHKMTAGDMEKLTPAQADSLMKVMPQDEQMAIGTAMTKHATDGDTAAVRKMTMQELIDEGKKMGTK